MTKHARSCGETRGEEAYDVETRSMQENARKCGEATGEPDMKSNEFWKLLRGTGEEV